MIGATLGSYRIVSEIGSGGMGVVYLAEHTLLGRKAAVKLLRAELPEEYVERFFNEAKAAATLHHPGLVDVFDFGHHTDGSAYIVMEFLPGESLAERLEREPKLPLALGLSIARSVANALFVAHEQGIIHRDLKPGNIFLIPDTDAPTGIRTKVLDFGIAKLMRDRDDARTVKTQSGAVIGTPQYMSPEQCKNAKTVDGRADIYSLGCILYEMLLGAAPFEYDTWAELVGAHLHEVPAKPSVIDPKISSDVEILIQKMLEKSPDARFSSMQDLAQSIEVLLLQLGERVRLTPPILQRPSARQLDDLDDATVQATATSALAATGSFADTDMKKPNAATLAGTAAPTPSTTPAAVVSAAVAPTLVPAATAAPTPTREVSASGSPQVAEAQIQTEPVVKINRVPWATIALGAAGLVLLSVAGAVYMTKNKQPPSETAFIVVDERGSDGSATQKPIESIAVDAGAAILDVPADAAVANVASGSSTPRRPPTETDVSALTRTFGKQSPAITACFKQHGDTTEKVSIRIQIDRQGVVQAAQVLPDIVGASPLGTCIAAVATKTSFGPQPKGATFRVPLLTSGR